MLVFAACAPVVAARQCRGVPGRQAHGGHAARAAYAEAQLANSKMLQLTIMARLPGVIYLVCAQGERPGACGEHHLARL